MVTQNMNIVSGTDINRQNEWHFHQISILTEFGRTSAIWHGNFTMIVRPVSGRGNALLVAELKGFHTTHDFIHVTADASGVVQTEHQLVLGVDDENSTDGEGQILLVRVSRVNHSVFGANHPVLVTNDGKLHV